MRRLRGGICATVQLDAFFSYLWYARSMHFLQILTHQPGLHLCAPSPSAVVESAAYSTSPDEATPSLLAIRIFAFFRSFQPASVFEIEVSGINRTWSRLVSIISRRERAMATSPASHTTMVATFSDPAHHYPVLQAETHYAIFAFDSI